ncbi:hypothetical protein GCM10023196_100880 [Actinoallomurus vinaceus]|uniref:Secreted protein n=2 Tax=Actinoallomurus vinaceus TaxID=1080074 RepID=A0ABP8UV80_9ACTN
MMRTTTAAAIAVAAIATAVATPAGAATAPTAQARRCREGEPVKASVVLKLRKNSYATTAPYHVHWVRADLGCKGHISLQHRSGPHVKMRIVSCAKKPKVLSDWLLPPHSTKVYEAVIRNGVVPPYPRGMCFRIQAWKGKGVTHGGGYF